MDSSNLVGPLLLLAMNGIKIKKKTKISALWRKQKIKESDLVLLVQIS